MKAPGAQKTVTGRQEPTPPQPPAGNPKEQFVSYSGTWLFLAGLQALIRICRWRHASCH
jgi:hypothetical protein